MKSLIENIKQVPDVLYGKGATEEEINYAENKLKLEFSKEYKEYLSAFSVVAFDGREFTGLGKIKRVNVVDVTNSLRAINTVPQDWYVIEETNIDGIAIWQNKQGEIYQTIPFNQAKKIANSFQEYLFT